ncbi:MAG: GUN4 domain-containing protein [Aphanizomenon sp.]|jgi:hypothetical protein
MKFNKLFLATFLLLASSVISPVLAQYGSGSLMDNELRRRQRDQEQLDIQRQLSEYQINQGQAQQEEPIRNIIIGVLVVGGSLGSLWLYSRRNNWQLIATSKLPQFKFSQRNALQAVAVGGGIFLLAVIGQNISFKDYSTLERLLAAGRWKEADEETSRVMLIVANREKEGSFDATSVDIFPCNEMRAIDHLWVKYSNGRFGFSVQKRIYRGVGATKNWYSDDIWDKFGNKVGWKKERRWLWLYVDEITFDLTAPEGHLPTGHGIRSSWGNNGWGWNSRLIHNSCQDL